MTTPVVYATVADLHKVLDGTDAGTGTASQLTTAQLTQALEDASAEVSMYAGNVFDSSVTAAVPPQMFRNLTVAIAAFYATGIYLKHKAVPADHPVYLRYQRAMEILRDVREGKLRLDPGVLGSVGMETGVVINRLPPVFTGDDSNTRVSPLTGALESDVPYTMFRRADAWLFEGPVYQG